MEIKDFSILELIEAITTYLLNKTLKKNFNYELIN